MQLAPLDGAPIAAPGAIFVSVPAYRDSEAQWTLADLFAKAAHPERVGGDEGLARGQLLIFVASTSESRHQVEAVSPCAIIPHPAAQPCATRTHIPPVAVTAQVRVGIVWQVELPGDAAMVRLAGDQRWLGQASTCSSF